MSDSITKVWVISYVVDFTVHHELTPFNELLKNILFIFTIQFCASLNVQDLIIIKTTGKVHIITRGYKLWYYTLLLIPFSKSSSTSTRIKSNLIKHTCLNYLF